MSTSNNEVKEVNDLAKKITKENHVNKGSTSDSLIVDTGNLPTKNALERGAALNDIPDGREFDSDINERFLSNWKRSQQFKKGAICLTSEKFFQLHEEQFDERKSLWDDFFKKMRRFLDLDDSAIMDSEEAKTMQDKRHILPTITSQGTNLSSAVQRLQIMGNMVDNFLDELDELRSRYAEQFAKALEDIEEDTPPEEIAH